MSSCKDTPSCSLVRHNCHLTQVIIGVHVKSYASTQADGTCSTLMPEEIDLELQSRDSILIRLEVYVSRFVMGLAEAFYALCLDESSVQDETSSALDFCALYFLSSQQSKQNTLAPIV
jgi:hypothetical protein